MPTTVTYAGQTVPVPTTITQGVAQVTGGAVLPNGTDLPLVVLADPAAPETALTPLGTTNGNRVAVDASGNLATVINNSTSAPIPVNNRALQANVDVVTTNRATGILFPTAVGYLQGTAPTAHSYSSIYQTSATGTGDIFVNGYNEVLIDVSLNVACSSSYSGSIVPQIVFLVLRQAGTVTGGTTVYTPIFQSPAFSPIYPGSGSTSPASLGQNTGFTLSLGNVGSAVAWTCTAGSTETAAPAYGYGYAYGQGLATPGATTFLAVMQSGTAISTTASYNTYFLDVGPLQEVVTISSVSGTYPNQSVTLAAGTTLPHSAGPVLLSPTSGTTLSASGHVYNGGTSVTNRTTAHYSVPASLGVAVQVAWIVTPGVTWGTLPAQGGFAFGIEVIGK